LQRGKPIKHIHLYLKQIALRPSGLFISAEFKWLIQMPLDEIVSAPLQQVLYEIAGISICQAHQ
jgi:hypothetical protein